jgi:DNA adenine methylase
MNQLTLFGDTPPPSIVNVASVPQRSLFRYPGGKTWFVPHVRRWISSQNKKPKFFIEPFAGGGIIGLTVAFERLADRVILVEKDDQVAAVWKVVLGNQADDLAEKILDFEMTFDNIQQELADNSENVLEKAFQTILRNRTLHGGILAPGSGFIKNGENGKGVLSRWYPVTLAKRIRNIRMIAERIEFIEGNGFDVILRFANVKDAAFFIDPPYTVAGKRAGTRLYRFNEIDHAKLFELVSRVSGDFLMTYDQCSEVANLARKHGLEMGEIFMKNTHNKAMSELVISRNLHWMKGF